MSHPSLQSYTPHSDAPSSTASHATPSRKPISIKSIDIEKNIKSQKTPSTWSRLAVDWWTWELAAAFLSLASTTAICVVLVAYDQKPVPQLPHGITLNAIISFLATVAKSSLMVAVAATINQDKWLWFLKKPRALNSINAFEDASRGPFGSFMMLVKRYGSVSAWIAAIVTICGIGFEPFLQQLVVFYSKSVPVDNLTASILTPTAYNESFATNLGGADLQLTALVGCFGGATGAVPQPVCPGGNCAWPTYHSLALCSQCKDVTDQVSTSGEQYQVNFTAIINDRSSRNITDETQQTYATTYSFPNGRSVTRSVELSLYGTDQVQIDIQYPRRVVWPLNIDGSPNSNWYYSWARETYAGIDGPLLAMGYLDLDLNSDMSQLEVKQAMQCSLTPCVREFESEMVGGKLNTTVVATNHGNVTTTGSDPYMIFGWTASVNGTDYAVTDRGQGGTGGWAGNLIQSLRVALEGNTTYSTGKLCQGSSDCDPDIHTGYTMTGGPWSSSAQQAIDAATNFTQIVEGVATALTGRFQQLSDSRVEGQVLQTQTFVQVRWAWIVYPLALVLIGITTLLATIFQTKRARMAVWKFSALPLLYRYVGRQKSGLGVAVKGGQLNSISYLDEAAGKERVRLVEDGDAAKVWVLKGEH